MFYSIHKMTKIPFVWLVCLMFTVALPIADSGAQPPSAKAGKSGKPGQGAPKGGRFAGMPAMVVVVTAAEETVIQSHTWYSGTLISRNDATLSPESDGKILHIAEAGTLFKTGDTVVQLDTTLLKLDLDEAKADTNSQRAQIDFLSKETQRLAQLVKGDNVAKSEYERVESQLNSSKAMLEAARARSALIAEKINRMQVKAPFDGVVSMRYSSQGEWMQSGDPVVDFVDLHRLEIAVEVSARDIPFIQVGDTVNVVVDESRKQGAIRARVQTIVPVGSKQSRLFALRLTPPANLAMIGQLIRVAIPNSLPQNSLVVPEDALVIRSGGISVFTVDDSLMIAKRVAVQIGKSQNGVVEVTGRLQSGDKVVIRGGERLIDGMPIRFSNSPIGQ